MNEFIKPASVSDNYIESPFEELFEAVAGSDISDIDIEEEKVIKDVLEDCTESSDIVVVGGDDDSAEGINESENNEKTIIYIVKTDSASDDGSVSCNAVFRLNDDQFEYLCDTISNCRPEDQKTEAVPIVVNVSDNSAYYEKINDSITGLTGLNIILIGMAFGYFVKETLFRGL